MGAVERALWRSCVAALALGFVAVVARAWVSGGEAGLGPGISDYFGARAPLAAGLALLAVGAAALVAERLFGRRAPRPVRSGGPAISPVAVVDAEVAAAVREILAELRADLAQLLEARSPDVPRFVDVLLAGAVRAGASDVHLHPVEAGTDVAFRVHGVLTEIVRFPRQHHKQLVTRLKVMGQLVTYKSDRPQDGHFVVGAGESSADVRISVLPTNHGEKVVLRIARVGVDVPGLEELGFPARAGQRYRELLASPQGIVFLTGPTGSGKTTTIYASLKHIKDSRGGTTQVATIEDPVEFDVPFLTQTQVRADVGLTFAQGLRSILRQDPNVIMVGEIRDAETAHIAVQAGLTGHQIVTTVHADSAAGVFNRLIEMGVEPFLLASASLACLSQRLVRALCPHCRVPKRPESDELARLARAGWGKFDFAIAPGCAKCDGSGYLGRVALFELLEVTPRLRELINQKVPTARIHEAAMEEGMQPLLHAGLEKANAGVTSLREVFRVCG